MNEKEREQVALFRYGLIAPLLNEQVDTKQYFEKLAGKKKKKKGKKEKPTSPTPYQIPVKQTEHQLCLFSVS
jgi:hypothetical protein